NEQQHEEKGGGAGRAPPRKFDEGLCVPATDYRDADPRGGAKRAPSQDERRTRCRTQEHDRPAREGGQGVPKQGAGNPAGGMTAAKERESEGQARNRRERKKENVDHSAPTTHSEDDPGGRQEQR